MLQRGLLRDQARPAFVGLTHRHLTVALMALALVSVFAITLPSWLAEQHSLIRLLHWWMVAVQGDDSWKPMRAAYDWFVHGDGSTIYRHIFFDQHIKFQYPPSSLLLFAIPDALGLPVSNRTLNLIGWISVPVVTVATAAHAWILTRDWPGRSLRIAATVLTAALAFTFYPVQWAYTQGQIQLWFTALFAIASLCWLGGRKGAAGAIIGVICFAKPQFLLILVWALLRREKSFAVAMAVVLAITFAASLYWFGWANHVDYLSALSHMSHHGEAFIRNYSVNGIMNRLLGNGYNLDFLPNEYAPYHPLVYGTTLLSSAVLIGFALFWQRSKPASLIDFFIIALTLTMASPIAWEHHYGILPPIFAVLALMLTREKAHWPAVASLFLAFVASDIYLPPLPQFEAGITSLLQSPLYFGALAVLVLLYRRRGLPLQPHKYALGVEQVAEQPAHHRIGERAKK
jgi:hypothetical protein